MEIKKESKLKNIYPFIRAALVNIAEKENKEIFLEYKFENKMFDIFLPRGLSIFGEDFDNVPVVVEVKETKVYKMPIKNIVRYIPASFRMVIISNENVDFTETFENHLTKFLGNRFVDYLIKGNESAYISYLLRNKDTKIRVVNRLDENGEVIRREPYLLNEKLEINAQEKENRYITFETPDDISNDNIRLFKSYLLENNSKKSQVAFILGNGISIPYGSDSWKQMLDNLLDYLNPYFINEPQHIKDFLKESQYAMSSFVQATLKRDKLDKQYNKALHQSIYRKFQKGMMEENTLVRAIALSKKKYPSLPILTYNYDTFVEQQYELETQHKDFLKPLICDDFLKFGYNSIIHLHGYIGYHTESVNDVVLTDKEYFDAYLANSGSKVKDIQIKTLTNYKCIFIGSSMSDLFQMSVIQQVFNMQKNDKWCCFAIMTMNGLTLSEKIHLIKYYGEKGIYIIIANDYSSMPGLLANLMDIKF